MAKLSTLVDRFEGSSINSSLWTVASGTTTVSGGILTLNAATVDSANTYDFTNSSFVIEVGSLPSNFQVRIYDTSATHGYVQLSYVQSSNNLILYVGDDSGFTDITTITYNSTTMKFFRFWHGGSNGAITEYSANGFDWVRIAGNSGFLDPLTAVKVRMFGTSGVQVKGVNFVEQTSIIKRIISQDTYVYGYADDTPITLTWPSTPTQGNLLVLAVSAHEGSSGAIIQAPSGWSSVLKANNTSGGSTAGSVAVFYKIAGDSESTTVTLPGLFATGAYNFVSGYEYSGVDPNSPMDSYGTGNTPTTTATTTVSASAIPSDQNNLMFFIASGEAPSIITSTLNNSFNKRREQQNSTYSHVAADKILDQDTASQVDSGVSATVTWSAAKNGVAIIVSFRPKVSGVNFYRMDGHTSLVDAQNVWTDEANIVDANFTNYGLINTVASGNNNKLVITGTNVPSSGASSIYLVRARAILNDGYNVSPWVTITNNAGWTWSGLNSLVATLYKNTTTQFYATFSNAGGTVSGLIQVSGLSSGLLKVNAIELEVSTALHVGYFDGHTLISDPNSAWSNDTYTFSGNPALGGAYNHSAGSTSTGYLQGKGTNFPSSVNGVINSVRVRVYGDVPEGSNTITGVIYASGGTEQLLTVTNNGFAGNSMWATLTAPTGGWTIDAVRNLEVKFYGSGGGDMYIYQLDMAVDYQMTSSGTMLMMFR